jgi:hypothetical protein
VKSIIGRMLVTILAICALCAGCESWEQSIAKERNRAGSTANVCEQTLVYVRHGNNGWCVVACSDDISVTSRHHVMLVPCESVEKTRRE